VSYKVYIRKNDTGEVRARDTGFEWDDSSYFFWTGGNFGCDCNLEREFLRAGDEEVNFNEDFLCGTYRYTPMYALLSSGKIIYFNEEDR
jgi:hypothetical protein